MNRKFLAAVVGLACIALGARAAESDYDTRTVILDGEVLSVDWSGPQLKLEFRSFDGYDTAKWNIVGPPPEALFRMGWARDYLKAGDRIDAAVHPARDGSANGSLIRFYLSDGRTLEIGPFGSIHVIPREFLTMKFASPKDDPMAGFYGNTQVIWAEDPKGPPEANYNAHTWYNADHTMMVASNDLRSDGTWSRHIMTGIWWVEKQLGDKWTRCMLFTGANKPNCHSPVNFEKLGDKWTATLRGPRSDWIEHRELQPGRH